MASMHDDLALYVMGALEDPREFEVHLTTCEQCRTELAELRGTLNAIDAGIVRTPAPIDLRTKTLAAVRGGDVAALPTTERRFVQPHVADVVQLDRARAQRMRIAAIAGVAALALVIAGLGYRTFTRDEFTADRTVALAAPAGGPARGQARIDDTVAGQTIELTVSGLPDAPAGMYYECWWVGLKDADDIPERVSAGTFRGGTGTYRMQSAADRARFPNMGVTLEPDDGNPSRTGEKVLVSQSAPGASPTAAAPVTPSPSVAPVVVSPSPAASAPAASAPAAATSTATAAP
jgi:hypothetical protein